jgi:hypothetical protein
MCWYVCSAVQYAGFTVTPLFGSAVSYLGYHYPLSTQVLYIDEFSVPALCMGGLACLLALAFAFFPQVTEGGAAAFSVMRPHIQSEVTSGRGASGETYLISGERSVDSSSSSSDKLLVSDRKDMQLEQGTGNESKGGYAGEDQEDSLISYQVLLCLTHSP